MLNMDNEDKEEKGRFASWISQLNEGDGTEKPLPPNRKSQFFQIIKENYGLLIVWGLLSFLFLAPTLVFQVIMSYQLSNALASDAKEASTVISYNFWTYLFTVPLLGLASIGVAGLCGPVKKMVRGESLSAHDYAEGLKENWLPFLFVFLAFGVSLWALNFGLASLEYSSFATYQKYLLAFLLILQFTFVSLFCFVGLILSSNYRMSFWSGIKNVFILSFRGLGPNLLFLLLSLGVWIWPLFCVGVIQAIAFSFLAFLGLPYSVLLTLCYGASLCDKHINREMYPEFYRKGLSKE